MAFENFIPEVESKLLLEEKNKVLVLGKNCRSKYTGDLKKQGDRVIIKGINSPTIYSLNKDGTSYEANSIGTGSVAGTGKTVVQKGIPNPEELSGYDLELRVNRISLWNFGLGDIDEALSDVEIMGKLRKKQAVKLAETQDSYIASVISGFTSAIFTGLSDYSRSNNVFYIATGINGTSTDGNVTTDASETINPADLLDELNLKMKERNYGNTPLICECSEKFYKRLCKVLRGLNVNGGNVGKTFEGYQNITFFPNNSMTVSDQEYLFLRTADSVAYVDKIAKMEAYRPDSGFMDCIKGFELYDCGITDPNGLIVTKIAY